MRPWALLSRRVSSGGEMMQALCPAQWVVLQRGIVPSTAVTGHQLQAEGDDAIHGDLGWAHCQVSGVPELRVPKPSKLLRVP